MNYYLAIGRNAALLASAATILMVPFVGYAQTTPAPEPPPPPPSTAAPYDYKNEGIFGCNTAAGATASAGTLAAIGGVYVPVNDAAVTLNTGILVYKECVLRPLQDRLREAAVAALLRKQFIGVETGRGGDKQYVVNRREERWQQADKALLAVLTNEETLSKIHPAFKETVRSSIARGYQTGRSPEKQLECSYKGNVEEVLKGNVSSKEGQIPNMLDALTVLTDPACNPMGAYMIVAKISTDRVTEAVRDWETAIDEGRGFYPKTDDAQDPLKEKILTPASVVQESYQQILGSPVRQLEQANDIGQIVGALFAGVTTQALTDSRGLAGLGQSVGGRPAYLDQVSKESSQGVIGAAVNAALSHLNSARQLEGRLLAAWNKIAEKLTQTTNGLRGIERQCWDLIVPRAQSYASQNNITLDPAKIRQATSSLAFSQQRIDNDIRPLAEAALTNIQSAQTAVGLIDSLIAGVTNTTSIAAQRLALEQLDSLVAQGKLHSPNDVTRTEQQRDEVILATDTLLNDTRVAWGDDPNPSVGWCNINNPDVPRLWAEQWKK